MLCVAGMSTPALAQSCKSSGRLIFVGTLSNSSASIWLSATGPGSFNLEAAQGSQVVGQSGPERGADCTSRVRRTYPAATVTTHKLNDMSDDKPCLIDTQNQKGGLAIPPNITCPG